MAGSFLCCGAAGGNPVIHAVAWISGERAVGVFANAIILADAKDVPVRANLVAAELGNVACLLGEDGAVTFVALELPVGVHLHVLDCLLGWFGALGWRR